MTSETPAQDVPSSAISRESGHTGQDIRAFATQILTAYVTSHEVKPEALPDLVRSLCGAFGEVPAASADQEWEEKRVPAVSPKKSVFPDYIICLEDGKKLKLLRRHLKAVYNMTPEQYRERWGLPPEYPMVAPNYAVHRSSLARRIGLGRRREDAQG